MSEKRSIKQTAFWCCIAVSALVAFSGVFVMSGFGFIGGVITGIGIGIPAISGVIILHSD